MASASKHSTRPLWLVLLLLLLLRGGVGSGAERARSRLACTRSKEQARSLPPQRGGGEQRKLPLPPHAFCPGAARGARSPSLACAHTSSSSAPREGAVARHAPLAHTASSTPHLHPTHTRTRSFPLAPPPARARFLPRVRFIPRSRSEGAIKTHLLRRRQPPRARGAGARNSARARARALGGTRRRFRECGRHRFGCPTVESCPRDACRARAPARDVPRDLASRAMTVRGRAVPPRARERARARARARPRARERGATNARAWRRCTPLARATFAPSCAATRGRFAAGRLAGACAPRPRRARPSPPGWLVAAGTGGARARAAPGACAQHATPRPSARHDDGPRRPTDPPPRRPHLHPLHLHCPSHSSWGLQLGRRPAPRCTTSSLEATGDT